MKHITMIFALILMLGLMACTPPPTEESPASETQESTLSETQDTGDCVLNPPREDMACTMQYDPVCGCDGKTYSNACMAKVAGVPNTTPGACDKADVL